MLQQPNLELQLSVGSGKLPCSFRDSPVKFNCNPLLLIQEERLLQPDSCLIRGYAKHQALGLFRKIGSLRPRHDESKLAFDSHSYGKYRNLLPSQAPQYFFRVVLTIFSKPVIESLLNLLPAIARREERSSPERMDRGSVGVKSHSRIEEVEVEYSRECIEQRLQDSTRFADAPYGRQREDADQIVHAAPQPFDFSRRIGYLLVHTGPPLLGICVSRPPPAKFAEKLLGLREKGVLLQMPPNNDHRVRPHDVDHGVPAELR